jgi:8-oxo-dGTP diphosphatase
MEPITVVCAVILSDNKVLATLRSSNMSQGGLWEFPGGKMEENEEAEACIIREIKEELAIDIQVLWQLSSSEYAYPQSSAIRLLPFVCLQRSGELKLIQHDDFRFLTKAELFTVSWASADLPIVEELSRDWNLIQENSFIYKV